MADSRKSVCSFNVDFEPVPLDELTFISNARLRSLESQDTILRRYSEDASSETLKRAESHEVDGDSLQGFARIESDWWMRQMLVDRTLRAMAALTTLFALAMVITIAAYGKHFSQRPNKGSTSVGGSNQSCSNVRWTQLGVSLAINVAATMILGMSNTYQQLVTALKIEDLRHALENFGDSRVGTNSPFSINHKRTGKLKSWAAWLLLISTSLPIHFLANSLIGTAEIRSTTDVNLIFNEVSVVPNLSYLYDDQGNLNTGVTWVSPACWSVFRTGKLSFLGPNDEFFTEFAELTHRNPQPFTGKQQLVSQITVRYNGTCRDLIQDPISLGQVYMEVNMVNMSNYIANSSGCALWTSGSGPSNATGLVTCTSEQEQISPSCRLSTRMLAAFVLAGCLSIKAIYMILVTLRARGTMKTTLLTFGDVVVAAAAEPKLRIQNECMVNASDHCRYLISHSCHKHCTNRSESRTGDELGHCQKCKQFNRINKSASLLQPHMATKKKRSLVSSLGRTALTQMIVLSLCTTAMLIVSILIASSVSGYVSQVKGMCKDPGIISPSRLEAGDPDLCPKSRTQLADYYSGGWGEEGELLFKFQSYNISSELRAMLVANAAQALFSFVYLLLIYNVTLISQERAWGKLEHGRGRLRCTINKGTQFEESYLMQLPKRVLFPIMAFSILIHWWLGESLQMKEYVWRDGNANPPFEWSYYTVNYAANPIWFATALILVMTSSCWWAYSYSRQGFIPQMYGSVRVCCAAATELDDFPDEGVMWGDLGQGEQFRHAGLSAGKVGKIHPHALYAGREWRLHAVTFAWTRLRTKRTQCAASPEHRLEV